MAQGQLARNCVEYSSCQESYSSLSLSSEACVVIVCGRGACEDNDHDDGDDDDLALLSHGSLLS